MEKKIRERKNQERGKLVGLFHAIADMCSNDELLVGVSLLQSAYDASRRMLQNGDTELNIEGLTYDPEDPDLFFTAHDAKMRLLGMMVAFKSTAQMRGLLPMTEEEG